MGQGNTKKILWQCGLLQTLNTIRSYGLKVQESADHCGDEMCEN